MRPFLCRGGNSHVLIFCCSHDNKYDFSLEFDDKIDPLVSPGDWCHINELV